MTYVVSDLHGSYKKFQKLLKEIRFTDKDIMYILGDIVDYGEESMELIGDLSVRYNVYAIAGEHDYLAVRMLSGFEKMLSGEQTPDADFIADMQAWVKDGGQATLDAFRELDGEMREGVIDYLSDLALYEEVRVDGENYLLVHAGIADFDPDMDLEDCEPETFMTEPLDLSKRLYKNKTVVVGHLPMTEENGGNGKIFFGNGGVNINCGVKDGGYLGCLRLDDMKEFYV